MVIHANRSKDLYAIHDYLWNKRHEAPCTTRAHNIRHIHWSWWSHPENTNIWAWASNQENSLGKSLAMAGTTWFQMQVEVYRMRKLGMYSYQFRTAMFYYLRSECFDKDIAGVIGTFLTKLRHLLILFYLRKSDLIPRGDKTVQYMVLSFGDTMRQRETM